MCPSCYHSSYNGKTAEHFLTVREHCVLLLHLDLASSLKFGVLVYIGLLLFIVFL